jgi:hypothetical protein
VIPAAATGVHSTIDDRFSRRFWFGTPLFCVFSTPDDAAVPAIGARTQAQVSDSRQ